MKRLLIGIVCGLGIWVQGVVPMVQPNWKRDVFDAKPPVFENPMTRAKITVSGQWSNCGPEFINDGDIDSAHHWACTKLPAVMTAELDQPAALKGVQIWFYYADGRSYKYFAECSTDGNTWVRFADGTANTQPATKGGTILLFEKPQPVKFLRVTITGGSMPQAGGHIVELKVLPDVPAASEGVFGRAVSLVETINDRTAKGDDSMKTWKGVAWRNERVHGQFVVWNISTNAVEQLCAEVSPLTSAEGAVIPSEVVRTRFVRFVLAGGKELYGDILDPEPKITLDADGYRPIWLTVDVPARTKPGLYKGVMSVKGTGGVRLEFPLALEVLPARLKAPEDWSVFLDLWQHPWAVARYHHVKPFSPEHFKLMEPLYRELGRSGQKALTVSIMNLPWNHQNFDGYQSMIGYTKKKDGTWTYDYSIFDKYVEFGWKCGVGPQIHCYSMAPWKNKIYYYDEAVGEIVTRMLDSKLPEYEAFWGPFLTDFQKHLDAKGWTENVYMAMDERGRDETIATVNCVKKYAPKLKTELAGNHSPSHFEGIELNNYCQDIRKIDAAFLAEIPARRAKGQQTTFYVCCVPKRPNTFTYSPRYESLWLAYHIEAQGFDGFLRWAAFNWPRDPMFDSAFFSPNLSGDTHLLYPDGRTSPRWELLRDGLEDVEKIRYLKKTNRMTPALTQALSKVEFKSAEKATAEELAGVVKDVCDALESASRQVK